MIAKVKIAPVEQWCEVAAGPNFNKEVREVLLRKGEVSILTETMQIRGNGHGKFWAIESKCQAEIDEEAGRPTLSQAYACEHMLDID